MVGCLATNQCVFPVSPQEILLPPRFRALSCLATIVRQDARLDND
jgi:hypothetical protein